jgi:hypothetical protein
MGRMGREWQVKRGRRRKMKGSGKVGRASRGGRRRVQGRKGKWKH